MPLPEPLVTVRTYDAPDLADVDRQLLVEEGLDAYISGNFFRHRMQSALRVPESQAARAIELLPPELPTLSENLNRVTAQCGQCGGDGVHVTSPATTYILAGGAALAGWALLQGRVNAAIVIMFATVAVAAPVRALTRHYRCAACGHRWRGRDADVRTFPPRGGA